jgi:predicted nucleotidyltransferase
VPTDPMVLEQYAEAGAQRVVHWIPSAPRGPLERELERWESAVAEFLGT